MMQGRPGGRTFFFRGLMIALIASAMASIAAERWQPFTVIPSSELDWSEMSEVGRELLKRDDAWTIGKSEHFIVFGATRPAVAAAVDDAENALREVDEALQLDIENGPPTILVLVNDEDAWDSMLRGHNLRHDGLAFQVRHELYFKEFGARTKYPDRIAHEVVHSRLAAAFGSKVPLWLDEGLAGHLGWRCAVNMNAQRDLIIYRDRPAIQEKKLFSLQHLLAVQKYPAGVESARAFYRQTEEFVAVLEEMLGPEKLADLLHTICEMRGDPVRAFREAAGLAEGDEDAIVARTRARCLAPETR